MWYAVMSFCCVLLDRVVQAPRFPCSRAGRACTAVWADTRTVPGLWPGCLLPRAAACKWAETKRSHGWQLCLEVHCGLCHRNKGTKVASVLSGGRCHFAQPVWTPQWGLTALSCVLPELDELALLTGICCVFVWHKGLNLFWRYFGLIRERLTTEEFSN